MNRALQLGFGILLTGLAGYIDAVGFIRLGGLYTSFMSGNTTQLAVMLGHAEFFHAILPGLLLLMFLVGAVLGGGLAVLILARWVTPVLLGFEAFTILGALSVTLATPDLALASLFMALAMGAQNAVLAQVQGFRAGTTFVTGALVSFGQKLALALSGRGPRYGWVGDGIVWTALLAGALLGTLAHSALGLYALAIPAGLTSVLAVLGAAIVALRRPAPA